MKPTINKLLADTGLQQQSTAGLQTQKTQKPGFGTKLPARLSLSWRKRFCAALRQCPNIKRACEAAGVSRSFAYAHRARSATFRAQWQTALLEGVEELEAQAWQMAMRTESTRVKIIETDSHGKKIIRETIQAECPSLMIFLLKAHLPEKYCDSFKGQIRVQDDGAIKVETDVALLPTAELERIISQAAARGALEPDMVELLEFDAGQKPVVQTNGNPFALSG